jgi:Domain of Unknown Function with PDB structure (DUF3857)
MKPARLLSAVTLVTLAAIFTAAEGSAQQIPNLPALTAEELALKDAPVESAGAAAIVLYYGVETDNAKSTEVHALRIKVLREEGKKYADIEIPYIEKSMQVTGIRARVVGPDGKSADSGDQIYDREIVKAKKFRMNAKVLTLSNVQVGSIIEYTYTVQHKQKIPDVFRHPDHYLISAGFTYSAAEWTIQRDLFVRHAHFTLLRVKGSEIREHDVAFPRDAVVKTLADGNMQLDIENVPAYEEEEYTLPEEYLKTQVDLYYAVGFYGPHAYWTQLGRRRAEPYDKFIGKSKAIEREAARVVSPGDSDEAKLRKIYARAQQVRAVSFESEKSDKQKKQENLKENKNAEDVLTRGYGYANEINLLFIALARAAKFQAYPFLIVSRDHLVFVEDFPNEDQLNALVVQVRVGSDFIYLDPATRLCPYGLLPWEETDTGGVRVDSTWPTLGATPASPSTDAVIRRTAELQLTEDGAVRGKVQTEYLRQEALSLRLEAIHQDDAGRKKELEESMKKMLTQEATVNLTSMEGWEDSEAPLKASFEVEIPNFAMRAGRRLLVPVGIFHSNQSNPFFSARRVHPIYFSHAQETHEDVKLELPAGMRVESLPAPLKADQKAAYYERSTAKDGNGLRLSRTLRLSGYLFEVKQYPSLKAFHDRMLTCDSQQITLVSRTENAPK